MSDPLKQARHILDAGMERGLHVGYQLYVEQAGQVVADLAAGDARPGVPMRPDSLMIWLSSGKPITAIAVAQQIERGRLRLDGPIADIIPEFAAGGKHAITLAYLLTHTGGFRSVDTGWPTTPWPELIQRICAARIEPRWTIGEKAGYHALTSWYILAELVRRVDGRPFSTYVRDEIFLPLGMDDCWLGMPVDRYQGYGDRLGQLQNTAKVPRVPHPNDASEAGYTTIKPGGNARGPMRELGRFYRMLLGGGEPIVSVETVRQFTSRQRIGTLDATFRQVLDWGLGFMVNNHHHGAEAVPYGFGRHATDPTYGHGGAESSIGFADPGHDLVVCWVCNGTPGPMPHHQRNLEVNSAIYEDLHLT